MAKETHEKRLRVFKKLLEQQIIETIADWAYRISHLSMNVIRDEMLHQGLFRNAGEMLGWMSENHKQLFSLTKRLAKKHNGIYNARIGTVYPKRTD